MDDRRLIVNADDFGQSPGINRGIIEAHERGIVTSVSLMVRWPEAVAASAYARRRPGLSTGLHVDLGEWTCDHGAWRSVYRVVPVDDSAAVKEEIWRQLLRFRDLMGQNPTHLDSHQHQHLREPAASIMAALASDLGVPLRERDPRVNYSGVFYGQTADGRPWPEAITPSALIQTLETLPLGLTALRCHPGYAEDLETMYRHERAREVAVLCDPRVRQTIQRMQIRLASFACLAEKDS
jgi:chitin disaccharide deacetylase